MEKREDESGGLTSIRVRDELRVICGQVLTYFVFSGPFDYTSDVVQFLIDFI